MLNTKEFQELMAQFEKDARKAVYVPGSFAREARELWVTRNYYQNGKVNEFFCMYMQGYAFGKVAGQN